MNQLRHRAGPSTPAQRSPGQPRLGRRRAGRVERPGSLGGFSSADGRVSRRELLRLAALTGGALSAAELLAACSGKKGGSSDQAGSAGGSRTQSLRSLVADVPQLSILAAQSQLPVGRSRYAFGLAGPTNALVERASPQVWFAKSQTATPLGPFAARWVDMTAYQATGDRSPRSELKGYYVAQVELPSAGNWLGAAIVEVASQRAAGQGSISVGNQLVGAVGSKARSGPSPVATSAKGRAKICTRDPACPMHAVSFDQALSNGKPTVVSFATPLLCASRMCGPVVDEQLQAFKAAGDKANFVHVEIYPGRKTDQPAPLYTAWGLKSEPWLFVIDKAGIIRARNEGPVVASEITAALQPLLA
jgi:hypothetical protein